MQGVSCPGIIRRPSGGASLGLNRLSSEGVDLVADWGLIPDDGLELLLSSVGLSRVGCVELGL